MIGNFLLFLSFFCLFPRARFFGKLGFWLKACRTAGHDICQGLASGSGIKGMSHIISMTHMQQWWFGNHYGEAMFVLSHFLSSLPFGWQSKGEDHFRSWFPFFSCLLDDNSVLFRYCLVQRPFYIFLLFSCTDFCLLLILNLFSFHFVFFVFSRLKFLWLFGLGPSSESSSRRSILIYWWYPHFCNLVCINLMFFCHGGELSYYRGV